MNFDRIAGAYPTLERLCAGRLLHRCRIHHLSDIHSPKNILLVGEGHGRFLGICERQFPTASLTVIDSSAAMIATTRSKHPSTKAQFIHKNLMEWQPQADCYDLVVTHFVLDCFTTTELTGVIETLSQTATRSAQWLIADFDIPERGLARLRARLILWLLYNFFRRLAGIKAAALSSPDMAITESGFQLKQRATFDWGLLKSELWQRS